MTRRVADYPTAPAGARLNASRRPAPFVIALAMLVFLVNVARLAAPPRAAGDDPWGGQTLEWATSSPPPRHNFDVLPPGAVVRAAVGPAPGRRA